MSFVPPDLSDVSRETHQQLEIYVALLIKWNNKINLVSHETIANIWQRHIWDCVQLISLIPKDKKSIIDLGSGAGLPGIIFAIFLLDHSITLVEKDQRKCAFLHEIVRTLSLKNVTIINAEIDTISMRYSLISARALAPLSQLFKLCYPLMEENAICLFPKGKNFATEIKEAERQWLFSYMTIASKTENASAILLISSLIMRH